MKENMLKIRFEYTNAYNEKFVTEREVPEDFLDMDEVEILHDTYKNFLNNLTFPVGNDDEVIVLRENEYVETYCTDEDWCDGDCEICDIDD